MVSCSNVECPYGKIHIACLSLNEVPTLKLWYCPQRCRLPQFRQSRRSMKGKQPSAVNQAAMMCSSICICNTKATPTDRLLECHGTMVQYNGPKPELYGRYIDDCISAISSSREELDQFITSVNSFHPALKYTWEISEISLAYLDIKVSIRGNVLCTSVHYKPTDSHSYLLYSLSHPSHVKNSIPYSQFLRLRHLCSDDSDFSSKSEEMCQFFEKRGYPVSVVKAGHHRAQQFDRQSSLQTSQKDKNN